MTATYPVRYEPPSKARLKYEYHGRKTKFTICPLTQGYCRSRKVVSSLTILLRNSVPFTLAMVPFALYNTIPARNCDATLQIFRNSMANAHGTIPVARVQKTGGREANSQTILTSSKNASTTTPVDDITTRRAGYARIGQPQEHGWYNPA